MDLILGYLVYYINVFNFTYHILFFFFFDELLIELKKEDYVFFYKGTYCVFLFFKSVPIVLVFLLFAFCIVGVDDHGVVSGFGVDNS
jgi:hypothetical protein